MVLDDKRLENDIWDEKILKEDLLIKKEHLLALLAEVEDKLKLFEEKQL